MRDLSGRIKLAIGIWGVALSLFHLYTAGFGIMEPRLQRGIHLTMLMPLAFILFPATSRSPRDRMTWLDGVLAVVSLVPGAYVILNSAALNQRWEFVTPLTTEQVVLGTIQILLLMEATRRSVAPAMAIITAIALGYLLAGPYLPSFLQHQGFSFTKLVETMYLLTDEGIYGIITGVSATFAYIFVLFGAVILVTGTGDFFTKLATAIAGRSAGGPAKVSVVSSGLFGMVSGVGVSNVYATGSFTIPMMKKLGYRKEFAGAVEATASSGGQYMPPIMGAAAFIMAEITGIPYATIAISAFLSGAIYYIGVFSVVHLEAKKTGLTGLPRDQMPKLREAAGTAYLILPIIGMVYFLVSGWSAIMAGFWAVILAIVSSYFRRRSWLTPTKIFTAFSNASKNSIMLGVSCASAGVVVSAITHTGIGLAFTSAVVSLSQGILIVALILVMFASLILGMGLPSTAAYILVAALTAPALVNMGVDLLAAHLFAFYFANISCITPPVGVCFYAGASIAKAPPMKTGWEATKLGLSGYIVPYMFVYAPALLLRPAGWMTAYMFAMAAIAAFVASAGVTGWWFGRPIRGFERVLLVIAAVSLVAPEIFSTLLAATIIGGMYLYHRATRPQVMPKVQAVPAVVPEAADSGYPR
jgi:TRAP transporter 4TM/12TM fusion protein